MVYDCNYLSYIVSETLRIDPSVRISSSLVTSEDITFCNGLKVLKGQSMIINMF